MPRFGRPLHPDPGHHDQGHQDDEPDRTVPGTRPGCHTPFCARRDTARDRFAPRRLESRAQIGIAIGLIMARCELTSTEAFGHLSRMSQDRTSRSVTSPQGWSLSPTQAPQNRFVESQPPIGCLAFRSVWNMKVVGRALAQRGRPTTAIRSSKWRRPDGLLFDCGATWGCRAWTWS